MSRTTTDLKKYITGDYHPGAGFLKRGLWYLVNAVFFLNPFCPWYGLKRGLLRLFGGKIGKRVVIKPRVNIKYPWNLSIGEYTWIGEMVWIDNLGTVDIGSHACISQGALLLCGNHNYKKSSFDLMVGEITIGTGAWIGAKAIVGPGSDVESHAVLSAGSIATGKLKSYTIYRGNPAIKIRERNIES